jgi:hypothetical protein
VKQFVVRRLAFSVLLVFVASLAMIRDEFHTLSLRSMTPGIKDKFRAFHRNHFSYDFDYSVKHNFVTLW